MAKNRLQLNSDSEARRDVRSDTAASADEAVAMVEVDLLPSWYPRVVRRRQMLQWQAWATGAVLVVLIAFLVLRQENVAASQVELGELERQRQEADALLAELKQHESRLNELSARAKLLNQVGLPVEVTRMLGVLDSIMAPTTTVTIFEANTEHRPVTVQELARAKRESLPEPRPTMLLRFTLKALTPDPSEPSTILDALKAQPLLKDVNLKYQQSLGGSEESGARRFAFEITFGIDLLPSAETARK